MATPPAFPHAARPYRSERRLHYALTRWTRRIVTVYGALGLAWAIGGPLLIRAATGAPGRWTAIQLGSGLVFMAVSTLALSIVLRALVRRITRTHRRLAATKTDYRRMFRTNPGPMLVCEMPELRIVDANPAALAFFGFARSQLLGRPLDGLWSGVDQAVAANAEGQHLRTGQAVLLDGRQRVVEVRDAPMRREGRDARLVVIDDRTAEQDARARRDQALARLEEAQDIARLGWWEFDPDTGLGVYSKQIYRMLGRRPPPDALRRHPFEDLLSAGDAQGAAQLQALLTPLRGAGPVCMDALVPLQSADGRALTVHLRANASHRDGGSAVRGTLQDVTEREDARRLLHEREAQFKELVRVLPDGVLILHGEHVLYANAACAQQLGYTSETLLGESLERLVPAQDLEHVRDQMCRPDTSVGIGTALRMRRQDGSVFHAGLSMGEVRYSGRDCRLLIVRDLSEPERMRDALEQSNRELQAMARRLFSLQEDERRALSRDLHDDVGQAITAMKLSAHAAQGETDPGRQRDDLAHIVQLADASIDKLRNLAMLLRPPQLDALGLEAAVRWQAGMLFRASQVELRLDIDPLPERPDAEAEQACFRIAQESLTNALRHARAGSVTLRLKPAGHRQLRLEVVDDGEGFDPAGPRGLGLIVMRERAQTAGGTLHIDSAPGNGTRVTLHLPYAMVSASSDVLGS